MKLKMCISSVIAALLLIQFAVGCGQGSPSSTSSSSNPTATAGSLSTFDFHAEKEGTTPPDAIIFSGQWQVQKEAGAPSPPNALCQVGSATYPAVQLGSIVYTDLMASVGFKPISGKSDQAAGIIFRIQDKNNFYILRANALENNVNLYKFSNGDRSTIKESSVPVKTGEWQTLRVEVKGTRIRGFLNDQMVLEADDSSFSAGYVGLWTKSDSVSCFDDFKITSS